MNKKLLFILSLVLIIILLFTSCNNDVLTETPIPGDYEFDVQVGMYQVCDKGDIYEVILKYYCYAPAIEGSGCFDDVLSVEVKSGDKLCKPANISGEDVLFNEDGIVTVWEKYEICKADDLSVSVIEMKTGDVLEELFLSSEDIDSFVNMTPVPQVTPEGF